MSDAEEIKRLAELRDQGLITTAEFSDRKRKILKGKRAWWKTALLWIIGLWCLVVLISILAAIFVPVLRNLSASGDLACDMPEVKEKVVSLLNEQIADARSQLGIFGGLIPAGTQVHSLGETTQLYRDTESGFIACTAPTKNDKGDGEVGYTVSWSDRNNGVFRVEVSGAKELRARSVATSSDADSRVHPQNADGSQSVASAVETTPPPPVNSPEERQAQEDAERLAFHQRQGNPQIHGQVVATVEVPRHGTITLTDTKNSSINHSCGQSQRDGTKTAGIESAPSRVCWFPEGDGDIVVVANSSGRRFRIPASDFQPNADYVARVAMEDGRQWHERLPAPSVQGNVVATYDHELLGKLMLTDTRCQAAGRQFKVQSMGAPHYPPSSGCWGEDREVVSGFVAAVGGGTTRFTFPSSDVEMKQ